MGAVCKYNNGWSNISEHSDGGGGVWEYNDGGGVVWGYNDGKNNSKTMYTYTHLTKLHSTVCIALHCIAHYIKIQHY